MSKKKSPQPTSLECVMCQKDFPSQVECDSHIQDVHGPRLDCHCAHCTGKRRHDSAKLVEELKVSLKDEEVKTFRCIVCKYQVFLMCKCLSHIQREHNTVSLHKQYECMKCNVGFERCLELHNHILAEHPHGQKIARCGFSHCKKCFSNAQLLHSHLRQNHKVTKPFELLNSIKSGTQIPIQNIHNTKDQRLPEKKSNSDSEHGTSACLAPDPPSLTPPEDKSENVGPEWTCKICNKSFKSQTTYNNHMLVFHRVKYNSKKTPKKRRRHYNDSGSSESDVTSEDSDWTPSNSRAKSLRTTRASSKKSKATGRDKSSECSAGTSDLGQSSVVSDSVQHNAHAQEDDCSNCLACKQAKRFASIPAVVIKQEPVGSNEASNPNVSVISNVFSMNGSTENVLPNNPEMDRRNAAYNAATGSPRSSQASSSGWQTTQASNGDMCSSCLTEKHPENKCEHCGIIFLDAPMHMIHMLWHGEKHPFQCHSCGKVCKDKYAFTTHIFKAQHL